jgi:predicted acetyltransferase
MSRSDIEYRQATRDDIPVMADLWRLSFNPPREFVDTLADRLRVERVLVATTDGQIAATAQGFDLLQWFGGRSVPTIGVASVATDPRYRGTGLGTEVVARLLERSRDRGSALSTLYPATVPVYRRLGYEYAGVFTTYRVPLTALPTGPATDLEVVPEDGGPVKVSHERLAVQENGLTAGVDDDWWPTRVLHRWTAAPRGAVMTPGDVPDGYAAYRQESLPDEWGYRLACSHLIAHTREAALALFAYFRRFKGVGEGLEWHGPPTEPLALLLAEQSLKPVWVFRNMSRILDVPAAFESRGYPPVTGSATFSVEDDLFPDNQGPFLVEADAGRVQVTRAPDGTAAKPIPIGALSSMFTSYVTPPQAGRMGLVDPEHSALDLLGRLFAGPPPWTPDFF